MSNFEVIERLAQNPLPGRKKQKMSGLNKEQWDFLQQK